MKSITRITAKAQTLVGDLLKAARQREERAADNLEAMSNLAAQNVELLDDARTATDIANVIGAVLMKKEQ